MSLQYIVVEWLIPLVMVPFVARGRRPFPAIAWLGFIFAVPWVGVPVYLLIGEYGLRRRRRRHMSGRQPPVENEIDAGELGGGNEALARTVHGLAKDRNMPAPVLDARAVELLQDMDAVDRLVADLERARDHAHLLFFIYAVDDTGWRVARALAAAAERGVECRLLMDAHGSRSAYRKIRPWLEERGVTVSRSLRLSLFESPFRRIDVRNHRKLAVIDGRIGYTGSMNVHDNDFDLDSGTWAQITARVDGPAVARFQQVFAHDWALSAGDKLEGSRYYPGADGGKGHRSPQTAHDAVPTDQERRTRGIPVQLLEDGPSYGCDSLQPMLIELIHGARRNIGITTPYFVPDESLLLALRLAALRGIEVDLFVPLASDRALADAAGRALFDEMLQAGIRVHRHQRGVLHAKTLTVDGRVAVIGTANLDYRSFFLNYEVVLVVYHEETARGLADLQRQYAAESDRVEHDAWAQRPRSHQIRDQVARLFSPLL